MNSTCSFQFTVAKDEYKYLNHTKMALNYIMKCHCDTGISVYPGRQMANFSAVLADYIKCNKITCTIKQNQIKANRN